MVNPLLVAAHLRIVAAAKTWYAAGGNAEAALAAEVQELLRLERKAAAEAPPVCGRENDGAICELVPGHAGGCEE